MTTLKILFTTHPAIGHFHPLVPVAHALQARGHQVAFATSARFAPTIEKLGFDSFPAGVPWMESEAPATFPELAQLSLDDVNLFFMQQLFTDRLARPMIADILRLSERWRPDVIVRETWEFAGCLAADKLRVPHVLVSAGLNFAIWEHMVVEQLAALRSSLDLPPDPSLSMLYRDLYLDGVPPSFQYPDLPPPPTLRAGGGSRFDAPTADGLPEWFHTLPPRPLVYVTAGTVFNQVPNYFRTVLDALATEDVNVLVTTGRKVSPADFRATVGDIPANVRVASYIPQSLLLPHTALMIAHGGFNTVMGGLAHGVPILTIPIAADMGQNGVRLTQTGAGLCVPLHAGVARFPRCQSLAEAPAFSTAAVRQAAIAILGSPSFRVAAQRLQAEMERMPGPDASAALIEGLAASRPPRRIDTAPAISDALVG